MKLNMKVKRVKLHNKAFKALREDPALVADMEARIMRVKEAAGEGYEMSSRRGKTRHRVTVITAKPRAMVDNQKNNTLLRALDAGR